MENSAARTYVTVPEDRGRLTIFASDGCRVNANVVVESIRHDCAVLVRNVTPEQADRVLHNVAEELGLLDRMQFHAEFATSLGRQRI